MVRFGVKSGPWFGKLEKRLVKFDFKGFGESKYAAKESPRVRSERAPRIGSLSTRAITKCGVTGGETELREVADRLNCEPGVDWAGYDGRTRDDGGRARGNFVVRRVTLGRKRFFLPGLNRPTKTA
jgi:hypothetical protein